MPSSPESSGPRENGQRGDIRPPTVEELMQRLDKFDPTSGVSFREQLGLPPPQMKEDHEVDYVPAIDEEELRQWVRRELDHQRLVEIFRNAETYASWYRACCRILHEEGPKAFHDAPEPEDEEDDSPS